MFRICIKLVLLFFVAVCVGCSQNPESIYLEWIELNNQHAELIADNTPAAVKQKELTRIKRKLVKIEKQFSDLRISDSRRSELIKKYKSEMMESEARVRDSLYPPDTDH